jgi:hypothetical protein
VGPKMESSARFFRQWYIWNLLELYRIDIFTLYIIKKLEKVTNLLVDEKMLGRVSKS